MDKLIDYYMTPISPYVYLGHERFVAIARGHGATIAVKPINLGLVFPVSGGLPLSKRAPQRQAYRLVELTRWSRYLQVPLNLHPAHFPVSADLASRFVLAALERSTDAALDLALAFSRALWTQECDISDLATLQAISAGCGGDAGSEMSHSCVHSARLNASARSSAASVLRSSAASTKRDARSADTGKCAGCRLSGTCR